MIHAEEAERRGLSVLDHTFAHEDSPVWESSPGSRVEVPGSGPATTRGVSEGEPWLRMWPNGPRKGQPVDL